MPDYELVVNYGEDDLSVRVPIRCGADHAETERQALVTRIEHAHEVGVPEINATDSGPGAQIAIEPARVTSVDLVG